MKSSGFTIIELVAIIVILGVIAGVSASRYNSASSELLSSRDDLVAALFYGQQLAMARADIGASNISVVTTTSTIDVLVDNVSVNADSYPITLPPTVAITAGTGNQSYAKLGTTQANIFVLTDAGAGTTAVTLDASGYASF